MLLHLPATVIPRYRRVICDELLKPAPVAEFSFLLMTEQRRKLKVWVLPGNCHQEYLIISNQQSLY
jgi:hypothetical protein